MLHCRGFRAKVAGINGGWIMKRMIIALVASIAAGPSMAGDAKSNVISKIADVYATSAICKSMAPNFVILAVATKTFGVDMHKGSADYEIVMALSEKKMREFSDMSVEAVCAAGRYLYGPEGTAVKNMLVEQ
jgi:hypothetical protein